jgi:small subunit ribosomal protein S6
MRAYELAFIVRPDLEETAFKDLVDRVKTVITEAGGQVAKVDVWGKRKLAYPIRKQNEGQYVIMQTQLEPAFCIELERNLRLQEPVIRFLISSND